MEERIIRISETYSTNSLLLSMAARGAQSGQVLIAGRQSGGRGRMGRSFLSPEGGLYLSYLHRPSLPPRCPGSITAAAAVAVCLALERVCGIKAGIKWVNDIIYGEKKICGILCETAPGGAYVIGIGVNVNTPAAELDSLTDVGAAGILSLTGRSTDLRALSHELISALDDCLGRDCLEQYRSLCLSTGRRLRVLRGKESFEAFAESIDGDYGLVIRRDDGSRESLFFGEISTRL